ncbi:DUF2079 domain-containing protein [Micromonospora siamensis]|uniref:DUF2079 domain-containing protein n=1 Tax=Micromonospora siamensis TaxID=299152 RepID=UPI0018D53C53|nr:DUF2079 domain-containing protein [Micromonospora siamensis]
MTAVGPWLLAVALFVGYATCSIVRHRHLGTAGYDLGIFEQAVRAYAAGRAPVSELKGPGFNLLGDHFHPILALLAPAYRLFPAPETLLVQQAALTALSVVPIARLGMRLLGPVRGLAAAVGYGLSGGILNAVTFDIHEICFAVPMLAFAAVALVERRWAVALAWTVPLVLVKEDLPLTVAAVGAYLVLMGRRRMGIGLMAFGLVAMLLIVGVLIPAANPTESYPYLGNAAADAQNPVLRLLLPDTKLVTLVMVLLPTGFLAMRSPILLLAVPTLFWRFWSTSPNHWGLQFHYSAVLMPIVFVAMVDALATVRPRRIIAERALRLVPYWAALLGLAGLPAGLIAPAQAPPPTGIPAGTSTQAVRTALARVPDGAEVAASNRLAPQLTRRCEVYLFPTFPATGFRPEWVAITELPDTSLVAAERDSSARAALPLLGYREVARRDGVVLYRRW